MGLAQALHLSRPESSSPGVEEVLGLVALGVRKEDDAIRLEVQLGSWGKTDGERE